MSPERARHDHTRTSEPPSINLEGVADVADSPHKVPARLGHLERYQILGEHGRGGLGRVSRAHDHELGRDIAIKELISRSHVGEVRFMREALITARLEHPGIVPVYEAGRWPDGTPFYAMKLVAGRPLRDLIAERETVDQRIGLLHHVIAVADAIAYAHGRNIIHRDLKPANVIVGDFGETIVIDWGLAKDLSTTEMSATGDGPFRTSHDEGLTSAGSILGTPSYMSPEQERGEQVDQRADVFAIGAMLWELCALQKVPPSDAHLRHRMLRRAGIDKDLTTIIDKALDPSADRRYADAGALAADLKAFKSGARITARSYSRFAIVTHWMRRHRTASLSAVVAVALAVSAIVLYVRNIATERDRTEESKNRLTLQHAELLLHTDPTAAFDLLRTYKGADTQRHAMLRAEARGRGLTLLRAKTHAQAIYFARALADGSLVTLGGDGTVVKTNPAGKSTVISRDLTSHPGFDYSTFDYSESHHLLAYGCDTAAICLLDVEAETHRPGPTDRTSFAPIALAFSPSGDLLAAISTHGQLAVWRISDGVAPEMQYQTKLDSGQSLHFFDEHTILTQTREHVSFVHLDKTGQYAKHNELAVSNTSDMSASSELQLVAFGTTTGTLVIVDSQSSQAVRREVICKGHVNQILILSRRLPRRSAIAYACQDGDAGLWDLERHHASVLGHLESGAAVIAASADERYLLIGGNNGTLLAHDFTTQVSHSYIGHATRLTALLPPSPAFPYFLSGDASGTMRTWSPPGTVVRVAVKTTTAMTKAIMLPNNGPLIAVVAGATIPWYTRDGVSGELQGHNPSHRGIALSATHARFAMYGFDNEVELWSFDPRFSSRKLKTHNGTVTAVLVRSELSKVVVGSRDGSIVEWSEDDTSRTLGRIPEAVSFMRWVPNTKTFIIGGASDTLWLADNGNIIYLGKAPSLITSVVCSNDSRWLAIGTSRGAVQLYDIQKRLTSTIFETSSSIEILAFSPDSSELAIADDTRIVFLELPTAGPPTHTYHSMIPHEIRLSVRFVAFSPDNEWFAATCDHGDIWFYSRKKDRWVYRSVGNAKVPFGRFSQDGAYFSASSLDGQALLIDMHASVFN